MIPLHLMTSVGCTLIEYAAQEGMETADDEAFTVLLGLADAARKQGIALIGEDEYAVLAARVAEVLDEL
jgi:hypothetical protein